MNTKIFLSLALTLGVSSSAWADQPFRDHRYDSFKATPTESGQIVFAGNSITNMHSWFEAFGSHQEVIGRGNSGGFAYELLDNLENYIDSKPSKLFVMIGTNDISSGQSAEITAKRIETIVRRTRLESPETEVFVESILPRSSNPKPDYENCNTMVSAAIDAMNDPKVHFINLSEVCAPINGNSTWSHDGLHPRPIGYAAWTRHIQDLVGYSSVYPETVSTQNGCGLGGSDAARVEQFPYFPVSEGDVLFFGDEQVHGGEWHELLRSPKVKDRGLKWGWGGINLTAAKNVVKSALEGQAAKPAKIFLFYGIGGQDLNNYRALVDEAKTQAPDAGIYLVALTPSTDASTDATRVSFNASLKEIATEKGATFVDVYTPMKADIAKNIMNTNYVSGRGYVVMANELAKHLASENVNPVSLDEYDALYALRSNRKIIGDALTSALMITYGNQPGQVKETYRDAIMDAVNEAVAIVNNPDLTAAQATEKANAIAAAVALAQADANYPTASTIDAPHWYTLTSARNSRTLYSSEGKLFGGNMPGATTFGNDIWQFIDRGDNTFDIRNANGEYINPTATYNTQMSVVTTVPDRGFSFSYSDNGVGNFVIYSSDSQLNQTSIENKVYNWYSANSLPDRNDQGCAYSLAEYDGLIADPAAAPNESGWYEIKHAALDKYATNLDESYRDTNVYSYPLQYQTAETTSPKNWIYIKVSGDTRNVSLPNGFYLSQYMTNSRIATNQAIRPSSTVDGAYDVQYWINFTRPAHPELPDLIGRNYAAWTPHFFRLVSAAELDAYDIWTVNILATAGAEEILDAHVTVNSPANCGIPTVYNNGTLFLKKGVSLTREDLTIPEYDGNATPLVTIADHTVTIDYSKKESGISEISAPAPKAEVFDLWGRRARTPRHGVYIVNGQKVRL